MNPIKTNFSPLTAEQALENLDIASQDPSLKLSQVGHLTLIYSIQTLQDFIAKARKTEEEIIKSKQDPSLIEEKELQIKGN